MLFDSKRQWSIEICPPLGSSRLDPDYLTFVNSLFFFFFSTSSSSITSLAVLVSLSFFLSILTLSLSSSTLSGGCCLFVCLFFVCVVIYWFPAGFFVVVVNCAVVDCLGDLLDRVIFMSYRTIVGLVTMTERLLVRL